jgi:hypothetical protein
MAKKMKPKKKPALADDIRASLQEAVKYARGEKADVIVHHVIPSYSKARRARQILGLPPREPKAVRRALKSKAS